MPRPGSTFDAYVLLTGQGPVLVDPLWPDAQALARLQYLVGQVPIASLLTNDMHERAAYAVRSRWGTPVWVHEGAVPALEGKPDRLFRDGETLPGSVQAIAVAGPFSGDTVFYWPAAAQPGGGPGVLFTGDCVLGQADLSAPGAADHPRAAPGLYLHGHSDPAAFTASLEERLLALDSGLVCPAHGLPYAGDVQAALRGAVDSFRRQQAG